MSDPHSQTDKVFDELIGKAKSEDAGLLLEGLRHVCYTLEVLTLTVQAHQESNERSLTEILSELHSRK